MQRKRPKCNPKIGAFFESYLLLNDAEEMQLRRELRKINPKEVEAIMKLETSWHRKGRAEGERKTNRAAIIAYLRSRYGSMPVDLDQKLALIQDLDKLEKLRDSVFQAKDLEECVFLIHQCLDRK